ncbi:MAG TPA: hypothetical protein VL972_04910 [Solirubrobacteraceae bacterium]|nr:hypothetical protein [Solirubrobacteraceae bacterium]
MDDQLLLALSLSAWGDIGLLVTAGAALVALVYAAIEVRISRTHARLKRVYDYADRFNRPKTLAAGAKYRDYWENHSAEDWENLPRAKRLELMMLPNLIEEVAFLYNRRLLDRAVAAELLGVYVEDLWSASSRQIQELRMRRNRPGLFSEWEEMQSDAPRRQLAGARASKRRRARSLLARGE